MKTLEQEHGRNMTDAERVFAYGTLGYRCIFCGKDGLADGPRGGMSMNMKCEKCGAVLNLIAPHYRKLYGDGIAFFGQVIHLPTEAYEPIPLTAAAALPKPRKPKP